MKPFPRGRNVLEPLQQEARQGVMVIGLGQIEITAMAGPRIDRVRLVLPSSEEDSD